MLKISLQTLNLVMVEIKGGWYAKRYTVIFFFLFFLCFFSFQSYTTLHRERHSFNIIKDYNTKLYADVSKMNYEVGFGVFSGDLELGFSNHLPNK